jgi:hypothetical protein
MGRPPARPRAGATAPRSAEAPVSRLARALRRLAARARAFGAGRASLRGIVRSSAERGVSEPQIVSLVAEELFRRATSAGAFAGHHRAMFGPWLYEAEAEELVRAELARLERR